MALYGVLRGVIDTNTASRIAAVKIAVYIKSPPSHAVGFIFTAYI